MKKPTYTKKLTIHYKNGETYTQTRFVDWYTTLDETKLVVKYNTKEKVSGDKFIQHIDPPHVAKTKIDMADVVAVVEQNEYGEIEVTRFADVSCNVTFGGKHESS